MDVCVSATRLARAHRFLVVLESLARLLVGTDLLAALALDVALLHLLQERVGPAQPPQQRVRRVRWQENWGQTGERTSNSEMCEGGGGNVHGLKATGEREKGGNRGERVDGEDVGRTNN